MSVRTALAALWLMLQIGIPLYALTQPRPARWGWQMFAGISVPLRFEAVTANETFPILLSDYVGNQRGDLELTTYLPPEICRRTRAIAVRYRVLPARISTEFACPSR